MSLNRFSVADESHAEFGRLVKDWTRENPAFPSPDGDLDLFKQQLEDRGIVVNWPTGAHEVKRIIVTRTNVHELHFKIPPKEFLEESETFIQANDYPLPSYYRILFGGADWDSDNLGGPISLHDHRTGDYTVANCV